ncbi:cellobiose phosphorylase [Bacillus sp. H-16]|uniref:GH36-type glycosyl hydrolase domain-containing protein n=1 Tax=Alteribacter salitolerans TaxID=2912333 RepID=UPI001965963C|nr:cellobiose phosphorylase [Alteribacter salitolerans]MBM7097914.1 cellobiose phosphorylase [Alteribacter salitolerans]
MNEVAMQAPFSIKNGDSEFRFLSSGDILEAKFKNIMINQWVANPVDGSLNNLYLRIHHEEEISSFPLLGIQSDSEVYYSQTKVVWKGTAEGVSYEVTFHLSEENIWFWDILINGNGETVDVIYGQDLGLGSKGFVRNNEAYVAQYIDHSVFEDEDFGYVVCSRQNQPQPGGYPYIQQGSLTGSRGYSTDGFQFFGTSYKESNRPEALTEKSLPNDIYQYEFAYTGLQTGQVVLKKQERLVFYGFVSENQEEALTELKGKVNVLEAWEEVQAEEKSDVEKVDKVRRSSEIGDPLLGSAMTKEEIDAYFPERHQEEWDGNTLLSFFTDTYEHVVLKEKELVTERPHGHILMSGQNDKLTDQTLSTTSFMYGIFNSQLVVGNTSFNKMLTNARNALNVMKTSGQRIYIENGGSYRLLTLPSLYEIGFNYTRWYYKLDDDVVIITNFTTVDDQDVQLNFRSENGKSYRCLITNQVALNNHEMDVAYSVKTDGEKLSFFADPSSDSAQVYPKLNYQLKVEGVSYDIHNESKLVSGVEPGSASLIVLEFTPSDKWTMLVKGSLDGEHAPFLNKEEKTEVTRYRDYLRKVMNGFKLSNGNHETKELTKVNTLAWWYTHNMLVHFSAPHGLEQYGGAAWGTRDVCQGPAEFFMATQNYDSVKQIIKKVYTHQFDDDGNWPQWFMFDKYSQIQSGESHGDIIVWPLKVLGDYLSVTSDYSILQEQVPYTRRCDFTLTEETVSLHEHVKKQINYIKEHFLHDTHLSSYGDGDWDDTLQPANARLKQYMVSSWTVSLTYQVLKQFSSALENVSKSDASELSQLVNGIERDFNRYMLNTDVIPGFVYMEDQEKPELMVHPEDKKTGIKYRLLPMTRSMISELLSKEQAESHFKIIKENLYCPDGVRLMNKPANYSGGVSRHFKRAEQAANFGREIGLQYVHAHIRFIEAMAKLGKNDEVWRGLEVINPVQIQKAVPNAKRRQSNAYFSSSDGDFKTRYEAEERFSELRDGDVQVKGGWRIYSSGPGIYMNQLISNCLGVRVESGDLIIDPVLPAHLDGLRFDYTFKELPVTFIYHINKGTEEVFINGEATSTEGLSNRYRTGGFKVDKTLLDKCLTDGQNSIDVYVNVK